MKIYIAGPMAGRYENNIPAFEEAERALTQRGYAPVSPHRVEPTPHEGQPCPTLGYFPGGTGHTSSACFMRPDLETLLTCDAVYLLDGWESSRGAVTEAAVARAVGIPRIVINNGCGAGCADASTEVPNPSMIDVRHLSRQREWSRETFGPNQRTAGVLDHILSELCEIEEDPDDVTEWADVVILALDGAWRAGHQPLEILTAILAKQERNEKRTWPEWETADPDKAIEHVREERS